jgi:hypothetical protein
MDGVGAVLGRDKQSQAGRVRSRQCPMYPEPRVAFATAQGRFCNGTLAASLHVDAAERR